MKKSKRLGNKYNGKTVCSKVTEVGVQENKEPRTKIFTENFRNRFSRQYFRQSPCQKQINKKENLSGIQ